MGWISTTELNTSEDGETEVEPGKAKVAYRRRFHVLMDSLDDGPNTVANAPDLPRIFDIYRKGNDLDTSALATRMTRRRTPEQPKLWLVEVSYKSFPGSDTEGEDQPDLTDLVPQVRTWKIPYEQLASQARRGLPGESFATVMAKSKEGITNSAGDPYAAGIVEQKHYIAIEVRQYEWTHSLIEVRDYQDKLNDDTFWGQDAGTVKCVHIGGELTSVEDALIWRRTYEIHIKTDGFGQPTLDQGLRRACTATGSIPSPGDPATGTCKIKDKLGQPVSESVLLDGDGNELAFGGTPYVITWHTPDTADFSQLNLPDPDDIALVVT